MSGFLLNMFFIFMSLFAINGVYFVEGFWVGGRSLQTDRLAYDQPLSPAKLEEELRRHKRGLTNADLGGRATETPSSTTTTVTPPSPPPKSPVQTTSKASTVATTTPKETTAAVDINKALEQIRKYFKILFQKNLKFPSFVKKPW